MRLKRIEVFFQNKSVVQYIVNENKFKYKIIIKLSRVDLLRNRSKILNSTYKNQYHIWNYNILDSTYKSQVQFWNQSFSLHFVSP